MTRSVCLKNLRSPIAAAHDDLIASQNNCDGEGCGHDHFETEKAVAALQGALHNELGVAPPGHDPDFCKENDIDPNGVPCECLECRPAKDVSRG